MSEQQIYDDEIDLKELVLTLWEGRQTIATITGLAAIVSVIFALMLPNIYHSTATLAPASSGGQGGLASLASRYGNLASIAGIDLPEGELSKKDLALEVVRSRKFARDFLKKHDLKPKLMALDYWDADTNTLVLDDDLYDVKTKKWLEDQEPLDVDVYGAFENALIVKEDSTTGMVELGFKSKSPTEAQRWTNWAIEDLNNAIRAKDIAEAESSIAFLREQVKSTPLAELRKVFYDLIQAQTETIMLAQVREEYVFATVDPAVVPDKKAEPRRSLICILITMLGGMVSVIFVLARHYMRPEPN